MPAGLCPRAPIESDRVQERLIEHISTAAPFDDITLMAVRRL
jgi:hypothetical protein